MGLCVPATHRRVRCLESALRSHDRQYGKSHFKQGKSKEGAVDKRYITLWKILWEKRLLNKQITVSYQERQRSGSGLPQ